jgi:hypothetical protein
MTNQQHSITVRPELMQQWRHSWLPSHGDFVDYIAAQAAQWAADRELEACCEWLNGGSKIDYDTAALLRAARRPKPPSLKEQALEQLDGIATAFRVTHGGDLVCDKILAALEALPNE